MFLYTRSLFFNECSCGVLYEWMGNSGFNALIYYFTHVCHLPENWNQMKKIFKQFKWKIDLSTATFPCLNPNILSTSSLLNSMPAWNYFSKYLPIVTTQNDIPYNVRSYEIIFFADVENFFRQVSISQKLKGKSKKGICRV